MINHMVDDKMVRGMNQLTRFMEKIAEGNFGIHVDVQGKPKAELLQMQEQVAVNS